MSMYYDKKDVGPIPFDSLTRISSLLPHITLWRQFRREDMESVRLLLKPEVYELFGQFDLEEMTELSNHTVVVENECDQIIGCISLRNYANIPALLPDVWIEVFRSLYGLTELTYENTLFIHMLLWNPCYNWDFLMNILKSLFLNMYRLEYVVMLVPPMAKTGHSERMLAKYIVKMLPLHYRHAHTATASRYPRLYVSLRNQLLPQLRVRLAVAEDNDDLVNILDETAPELKKTYGEFYISEIILHKPTNRTIIVAELNNEVVGMMCLNTDVSLMYLHNNCDAAAYSDFCKVTEENYDRYYSDSIMSLKSKFVDHSTSHIHEGLHNPWVFSSGSSYGMEDNLSGVSSTDDFLIQLTKQLNISISNMTAESSESSKYSVNQHNRDGSLVSSQNRSDSYDAQDRKKYVRDVFIMELFGMRQDLDDRMATALIKAAFDLHPNLSYCLMSFPYTTRFFPLLSSFVHVCEKNLSSNESRRCVVTVQRNALCSPITVQIVDHSEEEQIRKFLHTIWKGDYHTNHIMSMLAACREDSVRHTYFPLIIRCYDTIIGLCVLKTYRFLEDISKYYYVSKYVDVKNHSQSNRTGMLKLMILHPAFLPRLQFVEMELFRHTGFSNILYKIKSTKDAPQLNSMLMAMHPLRPRGMRVMATDHDSNHQPNKKPYALYHLNTAMCARRKMRVYDRLIIVGCSTTANAFIEELIYREESHNVWFTSITLISPTGFTDFFYVDHSNVSRGCFFKRKYNYIYNRQLGLSTWVNVICGSITKIDRNAKAVTVTDGRRYFYDLLFLFCGLQFDYPVNVKVPERQPTNLQFINNSLEADQFIRHVEYLMKNFKACNIVFYGESPQTFTYLDICIRLKVKPRHITYIRGAQAPFGSAFNDPCVDYVMTTLLMTSGIKILDDYFIVDWKIEDDNTLSKIIVESGLVRLELPCSLFCCFERKIVRRRTIRVLNEAQLVFDGRLVINEHFQTNDPCIYSAGPMTKYRRIFYADNYLQEFYCSSEVGKRLARNIFDKLNPLRPHREVATARTVLPRTVHVFKKCKVHFYPVLDGYYALCIRKPGRSIPYALMKSFENYGAELITRTKRDDVFWGSEDVRYFRIILNTNNCVSSINCLTREPIDVHKFIHIWGHHETILGDMRIRYDMQLIDDFFEYFKQPWTYVLAHDHYDSASADDKLKDDIIKKIVLNKWKSLTSKQRMSIIEKFVTSPLLQRLETNLLEFLHDHMDDFPMYYIPDPANVN